MGDKREKTAQPNSLGSAEYSNIPAQLEDVVLSAFAQSVEATTRIYETFRCSILTELQIEETQFGWI